MASSLRRKCVECFGIRFDYWSQVELVHELFEYDGPALLVVTPNVDHVVRAEQDSHFKAIYRASDICVNDSRVLLFLCRLIGVDLGGVVPGSDLTASLISKLSKTNTPITVIGASPASINCIKSLYSIDELHHYNPPMGFIDDPLEVDKCIRFIVDHPSKFIFLAVGSPRQEILARCAINAGASGVFLCIGASLLFLSGEEKRAPLLVQKLSLEWLFRLMQSPRRLARRYLVDGLRIFPLLVREMNFRRRNL